MTKDICT